MSRYSRHVPGNQQSTAEKGREGWLLFSLCVARDEACPPPTHCALVSLSQRGRLRILIELPAIDALAEQCKSVPSART